MCEENKSISARNQKWVAKQLNNLVSPTVIDKLLNYCYFLESHPPIVSAYNLTKDKANTL